MIKNNCTEIRGGYKLNWKYFGNVPIINEDSKELDEKVTHILELHSKATKLDGKQTDENTSLKEEIDKTDKQIDDLVFIMYGLTTGERKIVEDAANLK